MKNPFLVTTLLVLIALLARDAGIGRPSQTDPYERFAGQHLHLKAGDKELFWFSGIHSNDPEHRMFVDIEREFIAFQPDLVLVEGGFHRDVSVSAYQAQLKGESAYTAFLARTKGIPAETMEPPFSEQFAFLLEKYQWQEVLAMYLLRQMVQYQREASHRDLVFPDVLCRYIHRLIGEGFPLSLDEVNNQFVLRILREFLGEEVTDMNWLDVDAAKVIYAPEGALHPIYLDTLRFRDEFSVERIAELIGKYDRIFMMMGADHIKNQEKRLRELFSASSFPQ